MKVYLIHAHSNGLRRKAMFKMASHAYIDFGENVQLPGYFHIETPQVRKVSPISPTSNKIGLELLRGKSKPSGILHMIFLCIQKKSTENKLDSIDSMIPY